MHVWQDIHIGYFTKNVSAYIKNFISNFRIHVKFLNDPDPFNTRFLCVLLKSRCGCCMVLLLRHKKAGRAMYEFRR